MRLVIAHRPLPDAVLRDQVDSVLIREAAHERAAQIIVKAIADLAHSLGLSLCAEGVTVQRKRTCIAMRAAPPLVVRCG